MEQRSPRDPWASFRHDPRDPAVAPLRASDADRDVVQGLLAEAFADGRLDREEYDERSAAALQARRLGELPPLVADLVPDRPFLPARVPLASASASDLQQRAEEKWRKERRGAVGGFLFPTLVCWAIWSASGLDGDFAWPWPLIVTVVTGLNLLKVLTSHGEVVAAELRRLERKQAKEIESRNRKNRLG